MTVPTLPEGITCDGEVFWSECPKCGNQQGDMGRDVECEWCGHGPMPTLEGHGWPACRECGRHLTPKEIERGMVDCGSPCRASE